jgi:bifunctional non-homologous end joining protein LigD
VITHPDKVLFPSDGITKGELAAYYDTVAPVMLPHLRGRPVTLERFPAGIGKPGFIQKDVSKGFPEWLERAEIPKREGGVVHYPLIGDARALQWLANQNCITPHVWASRVPQLQRPDLCLFDLDPSREDAQLLRAAALAVRDLLAEFELNSWLKSSGSKGFHIAVPLDGAADFELASEFADGVGALLVKRDPANLTLEFSKADREGRMLIDTGRNRPGATFAAAYAVRPKAGAPVSAPCSWRELEQGLVGPQSFSLRGMAQRLDAVGDPWADLHARGQSLERPLARLRELLSPEDWRDAQAAKTRRPQPRHKPPRRP